MSSWTCLFHWYLTKSPMNILQSLLSVHTEEKHEADTSEKENIPWFSIMIEYMVTLQPQKASIPLLNCVPESCN